MKLKNTILFLLAVIGCTTTQASDNKTALNINDHDKEIVDGIYHISYKAPRLLFSAAPSWKGLNKKAASICNRKDYLLIDKKQRIVGQITEITREEFLVDAYLVCAPEKISEADAKEIIKNYNFPAIVIDENIIKKCIAENSFDKELVYNESLKLLNMERYNEAHQCLEKIISINDNSPVNKKAYFQLGLTYETGRGVEQNMEKSLMYYQLSN